MDNIDTKIGEVNSQINKLTADLQQRHDEFLKGAFTKADFKTYEEKVDTRLKELEGEIVALKRPARMDEAEEKGAGRKAFFNFLRKGSLTPEEKKVLMISDDTLGGYLAAPADYVQEIIKTITEFSPIRTIARVRPTTARSIKIPKRTGQFTAARTAEIAERTERTGLTYGLEEMSLPEAYALVKVSRQDIEDSAFDLEGEIRAEAGEQFSVLEGGEFVSGNGVGKAEGFLSNAEVIAAAYTTAAATTIAADDLIGLQYSLKSGYVRNANWVMNRNTVKVARLLKEATTNAYIWQPGLQMTQPASLLGSPIVEAVDMPYGQVANQYEVAYGDFRRGYLIGDRIAIEVQRLVEKYAEFNEIGLLFRKRFNGQVILPEAIKILKVKA